MPKRGNRPHRQTGGTRRRSPPGPHRPPASGARAHPPRCAPTAPAAPARPNPPDGCCVACAAIDESDALFIGTQDRDILPHEHTPPPRHSRNPKDPLKRIHLTRAFVSTQWVKQPIKTHASDDVNVPYNVSVGASANTATLPSHCQDAAIKSPATTRSQTPTNTCASACGRGPPAASYYPHSRRRQPPWLW